MASEAEELLNLFITISSNDHNMIQSASTKLIALSNKPNYCLNLLCIVVNQNIEDLYRFSAGIQLKNIVDKNWQRGYNFTEAHKDVIRKQILSCAISTSYKSGSFYKILAEIISKISRTDWDKKWPSLFNDLFNNDVWFIIYRVCQMQSTRRLSQGIVLFQDLAKGLSGEIKLKWNYFISYYNQKCIPSNDDQSMEALFHNTCYQLKTMTLFIRNTHLLMNDDDHFCGIINSLSLEMCTAFPYLIKCYYDSSSSFTSSMNTSFYKLLKSMIWVLLSYQHKCPQKFKSLSNEIQNFGLKVIFQSNYLIKSDKLSLLIFNLMLIYLKNDDKIRSRNPIFDIQIVDFIRLHYLTCTDEDVDNAINDPELAMESKTEDDDNIIMYNVDDIIENMLVELVKGSTVKNFNEIMEIILKFFNCLETSSIAEVESHLHFIGIVIQSSYYADSENAKRYLSFLHCPIIIDRVITSIINRKNPHVSEAWKNYIFKRCVWLFSKWVVDDINIGTISAERLACASPWCFKVAASQSIAVIVQLEVCLYIQHIVEALKKCPSDFTDSQTMNDIFLNPSIFTVVSVIDHTTSSDTHTKLIDILIKLFHDTNMWSNIELVKNCANSIYKLWIASLQQRDTIILRDRLLECLSTIVKACDPVIIQPILADLSAFVFDSLSLIAASSGNANKVDNCMVLLDNTLQLWHDIVYNSAVFFVELDNIYSLLITSKEPTIDLDKNQTTLVLEIIQAHVLLKLLGNLNQESFSSLTCASWTLIMYQTWDPKQEEDLCVMKIQLFDLWMLGFRERLKDQPLSALFELNVYSKFLIDRIKELFLTTHTEPSGDLYPSITNGVLTILARLCLFDRVLLKRIVDHLSGNEIENQQFMSGLLERWLFRIDNQASSCIQQLFVLACIHWMALCYECYPTAISDKFGNVINSCIQVCSYVSSTTDTLEQQTLVAKALPVPAERNLRLAYLMWNPVNDCSRVRDLVSTLMSQLNHTVGSDRFHNLFTNLDDTVQRQFIEFCTLGN